MTVTSYLRGWPIYFDGQSWRYKDNEQPTIGNDRPCGLCSLPPTEEGHDPCLGTLPGVMNACCGHGNDNEAYIQFPDGSDVRGSEALPVIKTLIGGREA